MALIKINIYSEKGIKIQSGLFNTDGLNDLEMLEHQNKQGNIVVFGNNVDEVVLFLRKNINIDLLLEKE